MLHIKNIKYIIYDTRDYVCGTFSDMPCMFPNRVTS